MKYTVKTTTRFVKDYKLTEKRGWDISLLDNVIKLLANGEKLPERYKDHALTGNWKGHRDCHIQDDWVLIYRIDGNTLILTLTRTGTHSDLF
jgi:mRNA interferase YafQ